MVTPLTRQIKRIEKKEHKGQIGEWRRAFCKEYPDLVKRVRHNTYHSFLETITRQQKQMSCRKGCAYCCHHYVTVSVAHAISIVDYLYKKRKWLTRFLANYETWLDSGYAIADHIDRERLSAQSASRTIDRILQDTRPLSERYFEMNITCPFLVDGRCFIYELRPLSCSGHFSTSPCDWCSPGSREDPDLHNMIPNDHDLMEIARITDHRLVMYELSLPIMIYRLLTEGSADVMEEVVRHDAR